MFCLYRGIFFIFLKITGSRSDHWEKAGFQIRFSELSYPGVFFLLSDQIRTNCNAIIIIKLLTNILYFKTIIYLSLRLYFTGCGSELSWPGYVSGSGFYLIITFLVILFGSAYNSPDFRPSCHHFITFVKKYWKKDFVLFKDFEFKRLEQTRILSYLKTNGPGSSSGSGSLTLTALNDREELP